MSRNPAWDKWAGWLGPEPKPGTIYGAVVEMLAARQIWESFNDIVGVAPEPAREYGTFHSWFTSAYMRSQGLAIRRQVESRDDVISIGRLLSEIASRPSVLSRAEFVARFDRGEPGESDRHFDALTSPGAASIDPAAPQADLGRLRVETLPIKKWVDKEVAHYDERTGQFSEGLTVGTLHQVVDLVFQTMRRYYALVCGSTIVGSVVMPPWPAVFRVAWIPEGTWRALMQGIQVRENSRMT